MLWAMRFSIVIPTYNRSEKLRNCLLALADQDFDKKQYEIVVVDDGSNDGTQTLLSRLQKKLNVPVLTIKQSNQGQGVARNRGVETATGEIILLLGDDIVATPQLLKEHDDLHRKNPGINSAVLGFITWHPSLSITPLMRFMERGAVLFGRFGGHQFAFDLLEGKKQADWNFFYTSNISLKRELLVKHKFDPWFSGYGWEDIELGYRLHQKENLKIFYSPDAIAFHDHPLREEEFYRRMKDIGYSLHLFHDKHPELKKLPSEFKKRIFEIMGNRLCLKLLKTINTNIYFYALSKKYFLEGLKEGYNQKQL